MSQLSHFDVQNWHPQVNNQLADDLAKDLENGQVIYMPDLAFILSNEQKSLLTDSYLAPNKKNVSYNPIDDSLKGIKPDFSNTLLLHDMMHAFSNNAIQLVHVLFPHYKSKLRIGRTSFRPAEIKDRKSSYRKDDTRLHIDAFPSSPTKGERILRLFTNINPNNQPRSWNLGERYDDVIKRFVPQINKPLPGSRSLLKLIGATKEKRSLYDHYMLRLHNCMKKDDHYQKNAIQEHMDFPTNSTWIVFTDVVSHAALSGQHLLEQTFYLPVEAQCFPKLSPLMKLQDMLRYSSNLAMM